jgi:AAA domain
MSNVVVEYETAVARLREAAREMQTSGELGRLLKFTKGVYSIGDDKVPAGTEMIAHVNQFAYGWVKFVDGKVADQKIGKAAEGFRKPEREELDANDKTKWERDATGKERDPWAEQYYMPMESVECGDVAVFVTGSRGGCDALGKLVNRFALNSKNGLPIIKLNVGSYKHRTYLIVFSFAGDDPIVCKDYVREKVGLPAFKPNGRRGQRPAADIDKALAAAFATQRSGTPKGRIVAAYDYADAAGTLLYQVIRCEPKDFRQRRPDGSGGWINQLGDIARVPYRLPELMQYPDATVFITEGEKEPDRVAELGHCTTTVAGGKWTDDCVKALAGRDVLILEDNDEPGRKKALAAATALSGNAASIRIVKLPDLPDKGDVSDWLDAHPGRKDELADVCLASPVWTPEVQHVVQPGEAGTPAIIACRISDVEAKPVEWLWDGRIARGKLTLVAGEPGLGKSQIGIDLHARLSTGSIWPDIGRAPLTNSMILSAEDAASDTLRPRLEAADADLDRVWILNAVRTKDGNRSFTLQGDLDLLGHKIAEIGNVAMITIDPITSYMGKIDSHRTTDVRGVLEPLAAFAVQHNVAILAVSHPPKASQAKALHSVTGSLAFVAAARMVFLVVEEPETGRRLFLPAKNNLGHARRPRLSPRTTLRVQQHPRLVRGVGPRARDGYRQPSSRRGPCRSNRRRRAARGQGLPARDARCRTSRGEGCRAGSESGRHHSSHPATST